MKYHWYNIETGEIVTNFWQVLKTEISDFWNYHFVGIWKYSKEGF